MSELTPSVAHPPGRWRLALGAFLAPWLIFAAVLVYPPTDSWLRSFNTAQFYGREVTARGRLGAFSLMDTSGRRRTLADFSGKVVLLAFGYTHCPDACPTTLARMAKVRQLLGADAAKVQVLFVTIDPERDDATLLENYVHAFDPSFIGLRGSDAETDSAARAFQADYNIIPHGKDVLVEHTVDTYLIDPIGAIRVVFPYSQPAEEMAQDVHAALREAGLCWPWSGRA